jgi:hypothetical protein
MIGCKATIRKKKTYPNTWLLKTSAPTVGALNILYGFAVKILQVSQLDTMRLFCRALKLEVLTRYRHTVYVGAGGQERHARSISHSQTRKNY